MSCDFIGLFKGLEVALTPFDFCGLAVFDKVCLCFVGVLFGLREEVDFERVVLEDVCEDAVADAC